MDWKSKITAVLGAVFVFAMCSSQSACAAPSADACALLTQAQVKAVLAVAVGAGSHMPPTYLKTCTWAPAGGPTNLFKYLTLSLQSADGFEAGKSVSEQMTTAMKEKKDKDANQIASGSAGGIGDDAYYASMGGGYTALMVKKGNVAFKVAIYGGLAMEKKKAMEKSLAQEILAKL